MKVLPWQYRRLVCHYRVPPLVLLFSRFRPAVRCRPGPSARRSMIVRENAVCVHPYLRGGGRAGTAIDELGGATSVCGVAPSPNVGMEVIRAGMEAPLRQSGGRGAMRSTGDGRDSYDCRKTTTSPMTSTTMTAMMAMIPAVPRPLSCCEGTVPWTRRGASTVN